MLCEVPGISLNPYSSELLIGDSWTPFDLREGSKNTYDENTPYSFRMKGKSLRREGGELAAAVYWYKVIIKDNIPTSLLSYVDEINQKLVAPAHGRIEIA